MVVSTFETHKRLNQKCLLLDWRTINWFYSLTAAWVFLCCGLTQPVFLNINTHPTGVHPSSFSLSPAGVTRSCSRTMQPWPVIASPQRRAERKLIFIWLSSNSAATIPAWQPPQICCQSVAGLQISRVTGSRLRCTQWCHRQMGRCLISGCRPSRVLREPETPAPVFLSTIAARRLWNTA